MTNRDLVVLGASAGGVEAFQRLMGQLPRDLPAALLLVQHLAPDKKSALAEILSRAGPLPAVEAQDGMVIGSGRVYVAAPDHHLLVRDHRLRLSRGPRENRVRPAIDSLFRSAAADYGSRVIGVLLTGMQDDGASGLSAVKRCGGLAVVQDPEDAAYPGMPRSALETVEADHVVPLTGLGSLLGRLVREPAGEPVPIPYDVRAEAEIALGLIRKLHLACARP